MLVDKGIYEYKGCLFEYSGIGTPWPIRKRDFVPYSRAGKKFYELLADFMAESDKEKYRLDAQ